MRFVQIQIPVNYEPICKSGPTTRPEACSAMLCSSSHSEKDATDQLIMSTSVTQHLQSVCLMFPWLQTLSPASHLIGR